MKTLNTPPPRYRVKVVLEHVTSDGDPRRETIVYESVSRIGAQRMYEFLCTTAQPSLSDSGISEAEL